MAGNNLDLFLDRIRRGSDLCVRLVCAAKVGGFLLEPVAAADRFVGTAGFRRYIDQERAVYASKHESALETYAMTTIITRGVMILKKELTYIPFFGWAQWLYGLIPVDRGAGARAMKKMLVAAQKRVEEKRPIIIFPEGHRMKPGTTQKYKPGFLFMAQNLKLPVGKVSAMRADRPGVGMRRNDRLFGNFRHVIKQSIAGGDSGGA